MERRLNSDVRTTEILGGDYGLGLIELNDEIILKINFLTRDLIWWIFGMSQAGRCILFRVSLEFGEACRILWRDDGEQFVQVMVRDGDIL